MSQPTGPPGSGADAKKRVPTRFLLRFHLAATLFWAALAIPTLLWWRSSIMWVAFMSLYANVASHWAAWQASRAEQTAEK
jgi:hypothetical protein